MTQYNGFLKYLPNDFDEPQDKKNLGEDGGQVQYKKPLDRKESLFYFYPAI